MLAVVEIKMRLIYATEMLQSFYLFRLGFKLLPQVSFLRCRCASASTLRQL